MTKAKANTRNIAPLAFLLLIALSAPACSEVRQDTAIEWKLVARHDHDSARFTQGLQLEGGVWLESSGLYGRSFVVLENDGEQLARRDLPPDEFAEGAAFTPHGIWLLTWRAGRARLLDRQLHTIREVSYGGEGWGLAHDGERLIMSNGSHRLAHRDPEDFSLQRSVAVSDADGRALHRLNELTFAHGLLWANVFQRDRIAAINPYTGRLCGWLHLDELARDFERPSNWDASNNVLNGIALDDRSGHLHVTGKRWPTRYEIRPALRASHRACAAPRPDTESQVTAGSRLALYAIAVLKGSL